MRSRLHRWMAGIGVMIIIWGIIHIAYTPLLYREIVSLPLGDKLYTFLCMFVDTGVSLLLTGALAVYSAGGLKRNERWAWVVALAVGVYVLLLGVGAVAMMRIILLPILFWPWQGWSCVLCCLPNVVLQYLGIKKCTGDSRRRKDFFHINNPEVRLFAQVVFK